MNNKKGFTLTELLAVIAIVAILSIAAMAGFNAMGNNSKKKSYEQKVSSIELAGEKYAKDTNLNGSETISVNKLVIMGYLQPDKSTESGLGEIINPVNGENMICDLLNISVNNDSIKVKHLPDAKDCNIARVEQENREVEITGYSYDDKPGVRLGYNPSNNSLDWIKGSVLLHVTTTKSELFNPATAYSVSYEYGGEKVEKAITSNNYKTSISSTSNPYNENTSNEFLVTKEMVGSLFNKEITVIFTMIDGSTYTRSIVVKMDNEAPMGYSVARNNFTSSSRRIVDIHYDDGAGAGVEAIDYTQIESANPESLRFTNRIEDNEFNVEKNIGKVYVTTEGVYYIYVKDKVGNISKPIVLDSGALEIPPDAFLCTVKVYDSNGNQLTKVAGDWFNKNITVNFKSTSKASSNGIAYNFKNANAISDLELVNQIRNEYVNGNIVVSENEKQVSKYMMKMKNLSNSTGEGVTCSDNIGVDTVAPSVSITTDTKNNWQKDHEITFVLQDNYSGFVKTGSNGVKVKYGWVAANANGTCPNSLPDSWLEVDVGTVGTPGETKKVEKKFRSGLNDKELTGKYCLVLDKDIIRDYAQNYTDYIRVSEAFYFDNKGPICTSQGGDTNWHKDSVTIRGKCNDEGRSGCDSNKTVTGYSYDEGGNVTKVHSNEINSTSEGPGYVYDVLGNETRCLEDRTVRIDKTAPNCKLSGGSNTWVNSDVTIYGTCEETGTYKSGCATDTQYTYTETINGEYSPGKVKDNAGNETTCGTVKVMIDKTKPTITSVTISSKQTTYNTNEVTVNVKGTDSHSKPAKACVQISDNVSNCSWEAFSGDNNYARTLSTSLNGDNVTVYVWIKDGVNNVSDRTSKSYTVYKACQDSNIVDDGAATCGTYSECTKKCGTGTQTATKTQKRKDKKSGTACDPIITNGGCNRNCNTQDCCSSVTYKDGNVCSNECEGTLNREAYSSFDGQRCAAKDLSEGGADCGPVCCSSIEKVCNAWRWSACTAPVCGGGTQYQYRTCSDVSEYDGSTCRDDYLEYQNRGTKCNESPCGTSHTLTKQVYSSSTTGHLEFSIERNATDFSATAAGSAVPHCSYNSNNGTITCDPTNMPVLASLADTSCQDLLAFLGKDNANLGFAREGTCFTQSGGAPYHSPANWECNNNPNKQYKNCYSNADGCTKTGGGETWHHCPRMSGKNGPYCRQAYNKAHDYGCVTKGFHNVSKGRTQCWCFKWGPDKYYGTTITFSYLTH